MTKTPTGKDWHNTDVTDLSENWTTDILNTSRRLGCSALAPAIVASQVNQILGRTAHIAFAMATTQATATYKHAGDLNSITPFYEFAFSDYHAEATEYKGYVLAMPPNQALNWADWTNTSINTNALGAGGSVPGEYATNSTFENYYSDSIVDTFTLSRGQQSNSTYYGAFNTYGGYRPLDVVVYAIPAKTLDTDQNHGWVDVAKSKSAKPVTSGLAEDCRARLSEIRSSVSAPVATWAAQGHGTGFSNAGTSPGDQLGMVVNVASDQVNNRVNLMDHAITSRNSDTPGVYAHGYRQGIGPEDTANGTTVRHVVHVLAHATNGDCNGILYAETKWSNSTLAVERNAPIWLTIDDVIINSAQNESVADEEGTTRTNKIDLYGSVNQGALYVHSITVARKVPQTA